MPDTYVYIAFVWDKEDFDFGPAIFKSVHLSFEGAAQSLFPRKPEYWDKFTENPTHDDIWHGPNGKNMIRKIIVRD